MQELSHKASWQLQTDSKSKMHYIVAEEKVRMKELECMV